MRKKQQRSRVSIRLESGLWKRTQHAAIDNDRNAQDIIAEALQLWFERREKGGRR